MRTKMKIPSRRIAWWQLAAAGAVLLVLGGLGVYIASGPSSPAFTPEVAGGPHLMVDKTLDDQGDVPYDQVVRSTFQLENTGDQPLRILRQPEVEVVEGC